MTSFSNSTNANSLSVYDFARRIIVSAETIANTAPLDEVLKILRTLSMEDFGKLLISMPNSEFPNLSRRLPRMASESVQLQWTGAKGLALLAQTVAFARIVETSFVNHVGRAMRSARILDFGVGYGRNIRSMIYYSDPEHLYGVDAWQSSLDLSIEDGVPAHLLLSDELPSQLPIDDGMIDVAFALSIFTHLSKDSAIASLTAIRRTLKLDAIAIFTVRPKEYWLLQDQIFSASEGETLLREHEASGFAFYPNSYSANGSYGDTSMEAAFFEQHGWKVLGYETTMTDPYQVSIIVRPN